MLKITISVVLLKINMPAYLYPISGTSSPITLQRGNYIFGRKKEPPHEIVIKTLDRSMSDNSDYPIGSLALLDTNECSLQEIRLPSRHTTKLVTDLAQTSSGFYILQYAGDEDRKIDILVNGRSLKTRISKYYDGQILTDGDEITFTKGKIDDREFGAESFRFSRELSP